MAWLQLDPCHWHSVCQGGMVSWQDTCDQEVLPMMQHAYLAGEDDALHALLVMRWSQPHCNSLVGDRCQDSKPFAAGTDLLAYFAGSEWKHWCTAMIPSVGAK